MPDAVDKTTGPPHAQQAFRRYSIVGD